MQALIFHDVPTERGPSQLQKLQARILQRTSSPVREQLSHEWSLFSTEMFHLKASAT